MGIAGQMLADGLGSTPGIAVSPASASEQSDDAAAGQHCGCSGNCGNPFCTTQMNLRKRDSETIICFLPRAPGSQRCSARCKCEFLSCPNPRVKRHNKRWCAEHMALARKSDYANLYGFFMYKPIMGSSLQVVCRTAFLLPHMTPLDFEAAEAVCHVWCKPEAAGSQISGVAMAVVVFAHAVKWPGAVQRYEETLPRQASTLPSHLRLPAPTSPFLTLPCFTPPYTDLLHFTLLRLL